VKRIVLLATVALVMAAMLMFAGSASAQGCEGFGEHISSEAENPEFRPFGQTLLEEFGTGSRSGLVHELQEESCS
jgi:hypothetical protein